MLELELKQLILKKFRSIKNFSEKADIPYTTVDSILKRGVNKANVINIIKMCQALNIDTDALSEGHIQPRIEKIQSTISKLENDIIKKYRSLDEHGKNIVDNILDLEYKRCSGVAKNNNSNTEIQTKPNKMVTVFKAAMSTDGQAPGCIKMPEEMMQRLEDAPPTDEKF